MSPRPVTLLTNFLPPYLAPFFRALAGRWPGLRLLVSTPMEANRPWAFGGEGLPVEVQRTLTLRQTWRHPHGFSEQLALHLPLDTLARLRRHRPEVVVTTEFGMRTLQAVAYRALHPDVGIVLWALVSEASERGRGWLREALRRRILRRVDAVMVNGESGARYVAGLGFPEPAIFRMPYTAPIASPAEAPAPRAERESRRLLYVGQLVERKGLDAFLAALAGWAHSHPEDALEFWIVGDGLARSDLERLPVPANVSVCFFGNRSYTELRAYYAAAGILVFPTLADEWGVVVNEALGAGLPVLGSLYSQAVEELVEEGEMGWTFRPDDAGEMSAALERALSTPVGELERMRGRCRERIRSVTAEDAAARMTRAIDFAASRAAGGLACPLCRGAAVRWRRLPHTSAWRCVSPRCGLRFAAPQPDDAELGRAYRSLYYPEPGRAGPLAHEDTPRAILEELVSAVIGRHRGAAEGLRLLDVGCGRGPLARVAAERGIAAVGIEPDERARACARESGLTVYASAEELSAQAPGARFDAIALWQVVEHLRRPWLDLAALRPLVAADGFLILATPNASGLRARLLGARWENAANPTHLYYFTERSLGRLLAESGWSVVDRPRVPSVYPHHGRLRRGLQRGLRALRLDGDLLVFACPDPPPATRGGE
jgi:glycosyltransferase involved in cell wall biosynthesis/SAM-dependent methyltransferase